MALDWTNVTILDLGQTATYKSRSLGWTPVQAANPEGDGLGLLTLQLKKGDRLEELLYGIWPLGELAGLMGERFRVQQRNKDKEYVVTLGAIPSCTCEAGSCGRSCKHLDALLALDAKGLLAV